MVLDGLMAMLRMHGGESCVDVVDCMCMIRCLIKKSTYMR